MRWLWAVAAALGLAALVAGDARPMATPVTRAATHAISYDRYSLKIDGRRVYIWSGEFHYWRLPSPGAWLDVLQKLKAAGYDATSIYFDWGYHSPKPGVYDFTGVRDVDRLLRTAEEVGLYVVARPGTVLSQAGKPPPLVSALMYGPGRATTYRPTCSAVLSRRSTSRTPVKSYLPGALEWNAHEK